MSSKKNGTITLINIVPFYHVLVHTLIHFVLLLLDYFIQVGVLTFVDDHTEAGKEVEEAVECREVK